MKAVAESTQLISLSLAMALGLQGLEGVLLALILEIPTWCEQESITGYTSGWQLRCGSWFSTYTKTSFFQYHFLCQKLSPPTVTVAHWEV